MGDAKDPPKPQYPKGIGTLLGPHGGFQPPQGQGAPTRPPNKGSGGKKGGKK